MAEILSSVDVGEMHFDERDGHRQQGVSQADACMGVGRGVEDDKGDCSLTGRVDAVNQRVLGVTLKTVQMVTSLFGQLPETCVNSRQVQCSVVRGLTLSEQIQIGTV